ncbi:MAG: hypothetical protein M3Z85_02510 [Acidobacteriota bacterium]|nr:hypothetical protein [Acidobacteriota bacterium]
MKYQRRIIIAAPLLLVTAAWAQEPDVHVFAPPGGGMFTFEYVKTQALSGGKLVAGAPYSADETSETTQTLADGNRIVRKTTARVYRDKDGRTRTDRAIPLGPNNANVETHRSIDINDAVGGVFYRLEPESRVAVKTVPQNIQSHLEKLAAEKAAINGAGAHAVVKTVPLNMHSHLEKMAAENATRDGNVKYRVMHSQAAPDSKTESLGKQTIEGVEAEGTRTTMTIPAGEIGNERPIQIVSERWFSPALQTYVLTKRNDPMAGETVYRLSNIGRSEPDASLFQIPPGYTVKDGGKMEGIAGTAGEHMRIIRKE